MGWDHFTCKGTRPWFESEVWDFENLISFKCPWVCNLAFESTASGGHRWTRSSLWREASIECRGWVLLHWPWHVLPFSNHCHQERDKNWLLGIHAHPRRQEFTREQWVTSEGEHAGSHVQRCPTSCGSKRGWHTRQYYRKGRELESEWGSGCQCWRTSNLHIKNYFMRQH
jgi:hypothetical protein